MEKKHIWRYTSIKEVIKKQKTNNIFIIKLWYKESAKKELKSFCLIVKVNANSIQMISPQMDRRCAFSIKDPL